MLERRVFFARCCCRLDRHLDSSSFVCLYLASFFRLVSASSEVCHLCTTHPPAERWFLAVFQDTTYLPNTLLRFRLPLLAFGNLSKCHRGSEPRANNRSSPSVFFIFGMQARGSNCATTYSQISEGRLREQFGNEFDNEDSCAGYEVFNCLRATHSVAWAVKPN